MNFWETIFLLLLTRIHGECNGPIVSMKEQQRLCGKQFEIDVQGQMKTVQVFLGIPYAKPPIEDLRFAKPVPVDPWVNKIRDALEYGPSCLQYKPSEVDERTKGLLMWFPKRQSEDCLYLNVFRPKFPLDDNRKLPVLLWIYGGSFSSGSGNLDVYNGEVLAVEEDVIVVTLNYRVGIFGFLFAEKDGNPKYDLPGNQGLWDQNLAIKWVKDNIESFGGDKEKITLFGESAGAASVSIQFMSPHSQYLFKRVMLQSGSAYGRWVLDSKDTAIRKTKYLLNHLNCPDLSDRQAAVECLRRAPGESLQTPDLLSPVEADDRNTLIKNNLNLCTECDNNRKPSMYFDCLTNPVVGDSFIPKTPQEYFETNGPLQYTKEFIIGTNKNEGMFFFLYYYDLFNKGLRIPDVPESLGRIREMLVYDILPEVAFQNDISQIVMDRYKFNEQGMSKEKFLERLDRLGSHLDFTCPTLMFAHQILRKLQPKHVYVYYFDERTDTLDLPSWVGVMHGYEIEYVFGVPFQKKFQKDFYAFDEKEKKLSRQIMKYVGNFARTGNVNEFVDPKIQQELEMPTWPDLVNGEEKYLRLGEGFGIVENFYAENCFFWEKTVPEIVKILQKYASYDRTKINYGLRLNNGSHNNAIWPLSLLSLLILAIF